jgi:hypothetical protein
MKPEAKKKKKQTNKNKSSSLVRALERNFKIPKIFTPQKIMPISVMSNNTSNIYKFHIK